jgi:dihydroorotate dehydrogenase subfamily 1
MDLTVNLAGITLKHPVMNAAGTCKTIDHVKKLARSAVSAVMVGSITVEARAGNEGNVFWPDPAGRYSLNSLGLPNPGSAYYQAELPAMAATAHHAEKPLFVSVAGFTPDEYAELTMLALDGGADGVELNLSCPHVWDEGVQKRIVSYDPVMVDDVLLAVYGAIGERSAVVWVKLSPLDPFTLADIAAVLNRHSVPVVTTTNTFPNAMALHPSNGRPVIDPGGGLAGLAGPVLKPIGLGQVMQLHSLLSAGTQFIGVGGISGGPDVMDYLAYASAVQVGTAYYATEDPRVFGRILDDLVNSQE